MNPQSEIGNRKSAINNDLYYGVMKFFALVVILTITSVSALSQGETVTVGAIDFFGHDGRDVTQIRSALPLKPGDKLSRDSKERVVREIREAVKRVTGREPTDVATFCCNERGQLTTYIGLRPNPVSKAPYNPAPRGAARLPPAALKLYRDANQSWINAMNKGVTGEDDSQGFALSLDPETRTKQLAVHAYVARHSTIVRRVLASASDVEHRQMAAEMLGYDNRSREQIRALVRAGRDPDEGVRNNAIRALAVLARSKSEASTTIPAECFIDLLNSPLWTDRNKSAALLSVVTAQRDARLLACLHEQALSSLIEMARWTSAGHAHDARLILGRIGGIEEKTLIATIARDEVEPIINAITTQQSKGSCQRCVSVR